MHHLLANDFYQAGIVSQDQNEKKDKLGRALEHARNARDLYKDDNGEPGFVQCKGTVPLIREAEDLLASLNLKQ